jgi:hypothetical protein
VLDPLWRQLYGGALREVTSRIEERARAELDDYWDHLRQRGVHERPPFAGDNPRRTELAESVWRRSPQVADLVRKQGNQMLIPMVRSVVEQPCASGRDSQCDERFSVLVA